MHKRWFWAVPGPKWMRSTSAGCWFAALVNRPPASKLWQYHKFTSVWLHFKNMRVQIRRQVMTCIVTVVLNVYHRVPPRFAWNRLAQWDVLWNKKKKCFKSQCIGASSVSGPWDSITSATRQERKIKDFLRSKADRELDLLVSLAFVISVSKPCWPL